MPSHSSSQRPKIKQVPKQLSPQILHSALKRRAINQRFRLRIVQISTVILAALFALIIFFGMGAIINPNGFNNANNANNFTLRSTPLPGSPKDMIVLLMGVDVNPDSRNGKDSFSGVRSDTMMLARIRTSDKTVSLVSIPRDTKVYLTQSGRIGKINAAFAMGGAEQAVRVVERALGIPIDRFAVINLHGIKDVIDALGGVDLYIEKGMRYHDNSGNLHINFEPGDQHLDGQKAMEYLRFRHDQLGDIGRIRRQQKMLTALTKKFNDPWIITKIPHLIEVGLPHLQTDLNVDEMLRLGWFGRNLNRGSVHVATLPGFSSNEGASYWVIRPEQAQTLLTHTLLDPETEQGNALSFQRSPSSEGVTTVGLLYPKRLEENVNQLILVMEEQGFNVVCQQSKEGLATEIVQHDAQLPGKRIRQLKNIDSSLHQANHVIAPIGGTFENLHCSSREDITLTLGNDLGI